MPRPRAGRGVSVNRTEGNTALAPRLTTPPRVQPTLSVVAPVGSGSPRTPFVALVFAVIGAGLVGLLLLNTAVNENAFRLHSLEKEQRAVDIQEQQLRADLDKRVFPGDLVASARRLGLVDAGVPGYIYLPSGRVVGNPTPAKARGPQTPAKPPVTPSAAPKKPTAGGQAANGQSADGAQEPPGVPADQQSTPR